MSLVNMVFLSIADDTPEHSMKKSIAGGFSLFPLNIPMEEVFEIR